MTKELVCISCPVGCRITAEIAENGEIISIEGNTCKRGETYARSELLAPVRMVTTLVQVEGAGRVLSVKTASPIPKELIDECLAQTHAVTVRPPVRIGDVIVENVCGTGIDVIATKNTD